MNKLILDTNVLIYGMDAQSKFHASAISVLTNPDYSLFLPVKVVSEFFAVCSKLNIPTADALRFYKEAQKNAEIIFPDPVSLTCLEQLIQKYQPRGNLVFDLEIVSIALANQITLIATANLTDFKHISEITLIPITAR